LKPLDLQSEPYQPTGSISADGIKNQLGRPKFDRLTLLVREAVQNSWDARSPSTNCVLFGMAGRQLDDQQREWLLSTVFRRTESNGTSLREHLLAARPATVLTIYDRGTRGLCGPTRADSDSGTEHANFVNLLRNVGQPPTAFRGGGTYGFGKTALFLASQVRTILVHTQIAVGRRLEQRFMAASLGHQYTQRSLNVVKRYTGRHWWGRKGRGGVVDPIEGREASEAAYKLGLPAFEREETGTSIAILLPDFDEREPQDALAFMATAILRSFWPKLVDGPKGAGTMRFQLSWNATPIPMPRPQDLPPLDGYVKAFANLQAHLSGHKVPHQPATFSTINCQRPVRRLGTLSLVRFPPSARLQSQAAHDSDEGPFSGPSHHTALMRGPHFVVNYLDGPAIPYEQAEYAGVFVASEDCEEAFARSEPPTHDDWAPEMLDVRNERVFVRVAARRIRDAMQEFAGPPTSSGESGDGVPLGAFSDLLGGLIPAERGTGARPGGDVSPDGSDPDGETTTGRRGTAVSVRAARVRLLGATEPESVSGTTAFSVQFDIEPSAREKPVIVSANPMVILEEGSVESEAPAGAQRPRILFWSDSSGRQVSKADRLEVPAKTRGPWSVTIAMPSDAAVAVDLAIEDRK